VSGIESSDLKALARILEISLTSLRDYEYPEKI